MRTETFKTVMALINQDPLTPTQKEVITGGNPDELVGCAEAAELLGISPITMRRIKAIPRVNTTRYIRYKRADVIKYREARIW